MCFRIVEDEGRPLNVDNIGCLIKCNAGPRLSVIFLSHRGNNSKTKGGYQQFYFNIILYYIILDYIILYYIIYKLTIFDNFYAKNSK